MNHKPSKELFECKAPPYAPSHPRTLKLFGTPRIASPFTGTDPLETYIIAEPERHPFGPELGRKLNQARVIIVYGDPKLSREVGRFIDRTYSPSNIQPRSELLKTADPHVIAAILGINTQYRVITIRPSDATLEHCLSWDLHIRRIISGESIAYVNAEKVNFEEPSNSPPDTIYLTRL